MRRRTMAAAVFGAATILTMGTAFSSLAAWQQENNRWIFTDNSGNRVSDSWRPSGGNYYYLDSNGRVATEGWRTINNRRYHFDSDGIMQYGWLSDEENLYYLGDENDGAAKTGWLNLEYDEEDGQEDGTVAEQSSTGTWFYFQENGRAIKAAGDNSYVNRTINGSRYYFDENGAMATGWVAIEERKAGDMTGISTLKYFGDTGSGQMARGWRFLTDDPEDSEDGDDDFSFGPATSSNATPSEAEYDGDGAWYYFDNSGVPAYLNESATSLNNATTRINGERYFFDEYGRMKSGLIGFTPKDGTTISAYFGADDSDGKMKNNRQTNVANEGGRVQNSDRAYRADGEYRYEYDNGTIYHINANRERLGVVTSGERLPEISYEAVYTLNGSAE